MQPSFAAELSWLRASPALAATLARGEAYALAQQHRFVMLEHVLLALSEDEDGAGVLQEARIDVGRLRDDVAAFLGRLNDRLMPGEGARPQAHPDLRRILEYAAQAAHRSRRPQINGAVVLAAIIGEGRSVAANILKSHGLTFQDAIRSLQRQPPAQEHPAAQAQGMAQPPAMPLPPPSMPPPNGLSPAEPGPQPLSVSPFPRPNIALPAPPPPPPLQPSIGGLPVPAPWPQSADGHAPAEPWMARPPMAAESAPPEPTPAEVVREAILAQARERVQSARSSVGVPRTAPPAVHEAAPVANAASAAVESSAPGHALSAAPEPVAMVPPHPAEQDTPVPPDAGYDALPPPVPLPEALHPDGLPTLHDLGGGTGGEPIVVLEPGPPSAEEAAGYTNGYAQSAPELAMPPPAGAQPPPQLPRVHPHHPLPAAHASPRAPRPASLAWPEAPAAGPAPRNMRGDPGAATHGEPAPFPAPWPDAAPDAPPPQAAPTFEGSVAGTAPPAPEDVLASLRRPQPQRPNPMPARRAEARRPEPTPADVGEGQLIENIPRQMRVAIAQTMEVRIARAGTNAGQRPMQGGGAAFHHHVSVTRTMAARLRAPEGGFLIEPLSPETQWIENRTGLMHDGFATWRWAVTPLRRGKGTLQLVVSARAVDLDGVVAETALPDQVYEIKVRTNYALAVRQWGGWLGAMVLGGVLGKFGEGILEFVRRLAGL